MRVFLCFFFWSIAAVAETNDWRYIDAPYGPATDERVLNFHLQRSQSESGDRWNYSSYFLGAEYQQSLSDEFALVWGPLPFGLIIRDPAQTGIEQSACRWSLGLTQGGYFGLRPQFNGYLRRGLSESQGYEVELEYFSIFPFDSNLPPIWTVGLKANYISQLTPSLAVSIGGSVWMNDVILLRTYDRESSHNSSFDLIVPVRMGFDVRLSRNVHVALDYEFRGIGLERSYRTHTVSLQPTIRW